MIKVLIQLMVYACFAICGLQADQIGLVLQQRRLFAVKRPGCGGKQPLVFFQFVNRLHMFANIIQRDRASGVGAKMVNLCPGSGDSGGNCVMLNLAGQNTSPRFTADGHRGAFGRAGSENHFRRVAVDQFSDLSAGAFHDCLRFAALSVNRGWISSLIHRAQHRLTRFRAQRRRRVPVEVGSTAFMP